MKYIDADKLRAEIERLKSENPSEYNYQNAEGYVWGLDDVLSFLDTLEEPEQPTMGYDEAYLNEKIVKASKSWEGVDVDKYMDEVRGLEPVNDCHDLKKHTKEWVELMVGASFPEQEGDFISEEDYRSVIKKTALHFAEWQKAKMMEGAVEGIARPDDCEIWVNLVGYGYQFKDGDKVKVIVIKED